MIRSPLPQVRDSKATENCKKYETEPPERAKKANTLILGLWHSELGGGIISTILKYEIMGA